MSYLKPFAPAMACQKHPLSPLPVEVVDRVKAFCRKPEPPQYVVDIDEARRLPAGDYDTLRLMATAKDHGFEMYLFGPCFDVAPGWPLGLPGCVHTHRRLGHSFVVNHFNLEVYELRDAAGVLRSYPGLTFRI